MTRIKLITFDLDDTLWDNGPTIANAEILTRKWIEKRVGRVEWGNFDDFINLREDLIRKDPSIAWDISKLRKEIFKKKINHLVTSSEAEVIANDAFNIFINKRHEVELYDGVANALKSLSMDYSLGVLTNGNADIYRFEIGKYFDFAISSLEAKDSKPNRSHFDKALQKIDGINFAEMLHIGDHQINDIFGAHALGIEVLWFNNAGALWEQEFDKPNQFYDWPGLAKIIEEKYESR